MSTSVGRIKRRADYLRIAAARHYRVMPGLVLQAAPLPGAAGPDEAGTAKAKTGEAAKTGKPVQILPRQREEAPSLRIGFTTSRKVGNAVKRNRARRRLKALAAEMLPAHARPGHDYVLIGRPATVSRPFDALRRDLVTALKRLGLHNEDAKDRADG